MVIDKVIRNLMNKGYENIQLGMPGLFVFHYSENEINYVVMLVNVMQGVDITLDQYDKLMIHMKSIFHNQGFGNLRILNLLFTYDPDQVKHLCIESDNHWMIDLELNRLIIYENQTEDFNELKKEIDSILEEELYAPEEAKDKSSLGDYKSKSEHSKTIVFTAINISLIILNMIVFILFQNINLLQLVELESKGALNWYYIKTAGEYYRFITSMFLHGDANHLFSNMFILLVMGGLLEKAIGKIRYIMIYFGSGLMAGVFSISYNMWRDYMVYSIGASGAIFGIIGAMVVFFIKNRKHIETFNIRRIVIFAFLSLYGGIVNVGVDNMAHFGGFIAGIILCLILYKKPENPEENSAHNELLSTYTD